MSAERPSKLLTQLVLKPTVHCYHRCPYCSRRQRYYADVLQGDTLELRVALRAIEEAAALGMTSLQLSGGDPLLYPHLIDVIRAGSCHPGVFVFMNSVGGNVTLERARTLIEAGLGAWNFSVDTLNPTVYERLRGVKGALSRLMKAVDTVREAANDHPDFCINYMTVITRQNFRDLPNLLMHCFETKVASVYLMHVYGDDTGELLLQEEELREFRDCVVPAILAVIRERSTSPLVISNAAHVLGSFYAADNSDLNYACGRYWPDAEAARSACHAPDYYALVAADGRVLPCCQVEMAHDEDVGNLARQTLAEIWRGTEYERFRKIRMSFCEYCPAPRHRTLGLIPKMCRQFNG